MSILQWLLHPDRAGEARNDGRPLATVERILQLSPHLRLVARCQSRLERAVEIALEYIEGLVEGVPAAREASVGAWSSDPYIHAFFGCPQDVARILSRSEELRQFFDGEGDAQEAFAVLGMSMMERRVLGAKQEGERTITDVARTIVNFSDHRMRACARTEAALRIEIVQRVVEQLVLEGLAQIETNMSRREALVEERELLKARMRLLERRGVGMNQLFGTGATVDVAELARLTAQIAENEHDLASLGLQTDALDRELDVICDVLANPGVHVHVTSKVLRLNPMNVVVSNEEDEQSSKIDLRIARIPANPAGLRVFSFVRFSRRDLQQPSMQDEAKRLLI
jgi:hypothetical protein